MPPPIGDGAALDASGTGRTIGLLYRTIRPFIVVDSWDLWILGFVCRSGQTGGQRGTCPGPSSSLERFRLLRALSTLLVGDGVLTLYLSTIFSQFVTNQLSPLAIICIYPNPRHTSTLATYILLPC